MSGSRLIKLMQEQTMKQLPRGIELATVIQPSPLIIRVDNMDINLEGDDLIVCEHLLDHEREYTTNPAVTGNTMSVEGYSPHQHQIHSLDIVEQVIQFITNLKKDDRVAVQALPGGQQYLVFDKVVVMNG